MTKFNDRKTRCSQCCDTCKYGFPLNETDEGPKPDTIFCFLGVSEEDREELFEEVAENDIENLSGFSDKFLGIMQLDRDKSIWDSPRAIGNVAVCQFYDEYYPVRRTPVLSDRRMYNPCVCKNCKHRWRVRIETDEGDFYEYYCMLDVPEEDRHYVEAEVLDGLGYIPRLSEFSERFCQIMHIEEFHDLWDTPRYVEDTDCCQFYERFSHEGLL